MSKHVFQDVGGGYDWRKELQGYEKLTEGKEQEAEAQEEGVEWGINEEKVREDLFHPTTRHTTPLTLLLV
jgi:hypothetical protein